MNTDPYRWSASGYGLAVPCTVLQAAIELGLLEQLPPLPRVEKRGRKLPDAPSDEEVLSMLTYAKGWLRTAVALATFAGLRMGEVRALEVRDIDWTHSRLFVRRALSDTEVVTPKSGHERVVPLAPDLARVSLKPSTVSRRI